MCGIIGMFCVDSVNQQIYDNLLLLQHRGQDSAGIVTMDNHTFHVHKQRGRVREAFRTRDMRKLLGNAGIGHVRYATRGAAASEEEVQPFYVNAPYGITFVHNGNLTNTLQLEQDLFKIDRRHTNSTSDTEIAHLRALRRRRGRPAPTELERGTCDDPIVLDPPGKFQCIVEAAIF